MSPAFSAMLEALRVSAGNIRSLGPAGALAHVYTPYRIWLQSVDDAIAQAEQEISNAASEAA